MCTCTLGGKTCTFNTLKAPLTRLLIFCYLLTRFCSTLRELMPGLHFLYAGNIASTAHKLIEALVYSEILANISSSQTFPFLGL